MKRDNAHPEGWFSILGPNPLILDEVMSDFQSRLRAWELSQILPYYLKSRLAWWLGMSSVSSIRQNQLSHYMYSTATLIHASVTSYWITWGCPWGQPGTYKWSGMWQLNCFQGLVTRNLYCWFWNSFTVKVQFKALVITFMIFKAFHKLQTNIWRAISFHVSLSANYHKEAAICWLSYHLGWLAWHWPEPGPFSTMDLALKK